MEDVMYDPPAYLWAITLAGVIGIPATACYVLYRGAEQAGLGTRRAALLAGASALLFGGWFAASAVIAGHGWYHTKIGHGVPWLPIAVAGFFATLIALSRIRVVRRVLAADGMASRLELPHTFRLAGIALLLTMALGHLPALFALPAGLGDMAAGLAAPLVARQVSRGSGRRTALWWNAFGIADLVLALILGAVTAYQLVKITPSGAPISELPLALIPTAVVPLLLVLHIASVRTLAARPAPARPAPARPAPAGSAAVATSGGHPRRPGA
jgi:hypothetical protein